MSRSFPATVLSRRFALPGRVSSDRPAIHRGPQTPPRRAQPPASECATHEGSNAVQGAPDGNECTCRRVPRRDRDADSAWPQKYLSVAAQKSVTVGFLHAIDGSRRPSPRPERAPATNRSPTQSACPRCPLPNGMFTATCNISDVNPAFCRDKVRVPIRSPRTTSNKVATRTTSNKVATSTLAAFPEGRAKARVSRHYHSPAVQHRRAESVAAKARQQCWRSARWDPIRSTIVQAIAWAAGPTSPRRD